VTEVDYSCIACLLMLRADGPFFITLTKNLARNVDHISCQSCTDAVLAHAAALLHVYGCH